ncbi:putative zinc finger protein [Apostichopus japonicus]|uniref:Putative zinc finger protein n=1 Tax=Stichopus japonicus TaxID=307972 RepID=A0A2G8JYH3_STIJA|nr:putative zinc finger protein [Apostichopus japonicus]
MEDDVSHCSPNSHHMPVSLGYSNRPIPPIRVQSDTPCPPSNSTTPIPHHLKHIKQEQIEVNGDCDDICSFVVPTLPGTHRGHLKDKVDVNGDNIRQGEELRTYTTLEASQKKKLTHQADDHHAALATAQILESKKISGNGLYMPTVTSAAYSPTPSDISSIRFTPQNIPASSVGGSISGNPYTPQSSSSDRYFLEPLGVPLKHELNHGVSTSLSRTLPSLTPQGSRGPASIAGSDICDQLIPPSSALSQYASSFNSLSPFPIEISPAGSSFASPRTPRGPYLPVAGRGRCHSHRCLRMDWISTASFVPVRRRSWRISTVHVGPPRRCRPVWGSTRGNTAIYRRDLESVL